MKSVFTSAVAVLLLTGIWSNSFSQCGPVFENFNTPSNGTAGFSGAAPAGSTFGLVNNQLNYSTVGPGQYRLTTPTLKLPASATTIDYGFVLSANGNASVSGITVAVNYVNTANQVVTTVPAAIPNSGTKNNLTLCNSFNKPPDINSNGAYRLIFTITADAGNSNSGTTITIDDYKTSSTVSLIPLPVRFANFSAKAVNNGASLTWDIEAAENVRAYEIERSTDGSSFSKIGSVSATSQKAYTFTDDKVVAVIEYYRIKSVDNNGQFFYSPILSFKNGRSSVVFKAFPTITHGIVTLQHDAATSSATIAVALTDGRVVKTIVPAAGSQQTILDLSFVQAGIYFVRYNNGSGSMETMKIIKQ
ncbi:MAG: T9SS type A sorting domain-containing protein [Bacteroidota bacterium]|nr:T9SS type A sorting domain-containing protein [Bacteroidota bacterium]